MPNKILWVDTETTGLYLGKNCLIQVAGMIEIDGEIKEEFDFKCRPGNTYEVSEKALEVNDLTLEEINQWPDPYETFWNFRRVLKKYVDPYNRRDKFHPAGYNIRFDLGFIKQLFKDNNDLYFNALVSHDEIDILALVRWLKFQGIEFQDADNCKLETICKYLKLEHNAHEAMSDIKQTRAVSVWIQNTYLYSK